MYIEIFNTVFDTFFRSDDIDIEYLKPVLVLDVRYFETALSEGLDVVYIFLLFYPQTYRDIVQGFVW